MAGTCTITYIGKGSTGPMAVKWSWEADGSGNLGGSSDFDSEPLDGYVMYGVCDPLADAPTDNYDLTATATDSLGEDVFNGALADRDTATTEPVFPKDNLGATVMVPIKGRLRLNGSGIGASNDGETIVWIGQAHQKITG